MNFKRYFGKIKNKVEKPKQEHETVQDIKPNIVEELKPEIIQVVETNAQTTRSS